MEKSNIEEENMELIDKELELIFTCLFSSFYDSLYSFRHGFY